MADQYINTVLLFDAETIALSADSTSDAIDLNKYRPEGYFSLQVTLTGSGTAKIECLQSNNGDDYLVPSGGEDIVTAHTVASGPGADGKHIYRFYPKPVRYMKIKVTETGGANAIVVTIRLAVQ